MSEALRLADQGRGLTSPNPAVGAVVVRDGEVVGRGFHTWAGRDHAEVVALREAGEKARGAQIYVTLEPCCHQGRTGPCTEAILAAGVSGVVAASQDPNPQVGGHGIEGLRAAGVTVSLDEEHRLEAERLNEAYFYFMKTGRPLVTIKAALTLDGKIAAPQDNVGWITSEVARADVQLVRHYSDAILTGLGTVLEDDCLLTDRSGRERSRPLLRIVLDSQLRIPITSRMITSAVDDVLVVGTSAASPERRKALERAGIRVLIADGPGGRTDPRKVLDYLAKERYQSLMVEAGAKVNWSMLDTQIADKVLFYYAPKILRRSRKPARCGREGAAAAHGCNSARQAGSAFDLKGRVRGGSFRGQKLMFTGIIEELGYIVAYEPKDAGARITVSCSSVLQDATLGASIAVNGACLTAVELSTEKFSADLAPETLRRTNLGDLAEGSPVNLERPLRANSRLDGHFVLGHVDATAVVDAVDELGDGNWWLRLRVPDELKRYIVSKGSLAVDGMSLTVAEVNDALVSFTIIPHTYQMTTVHRYRPGGRVNLEVDILAKHLEKLVKA